MDAGLSCNLSAGEGAGGRVPVHSWGCGPAAVALPWERVSVLAVTSHTSGPASSLLALEPHFRLLLKSCFSQTEVERKRPQQPGSAGAGGVWACLSADPGLLLLPGSTGDVPAACSVPFPWLIADFISGGGREVDRNAAISCLPFPSSPQETVFSDDILLAGSPTPFPRRKIPSFCFIVAES